MHLMKAFSSGINFCRFNYFDNLINEGKNHSTPFGRAVAHNAPIRILAELSKNHFCGTTLKWTNQIKDRSSKLIEITYYKDAL